MEALYDLFGVGSQAQQLTTSQVLLRALFVFFVSLIIVRVADKRFFARKNAFDVLLGFILGSLLARAITGSETLGGTVVAGFTLALLHRALGWLACNSPWFAHVVKGDSEVVIKNGVVESEVLKRHHVGLDDLQEELRLNGVEDARSVKLARLERSGEISVVEK